MMRCCCSILRWLNPGHLLTSSWQQCWIVQCGLFLWWFVRWIKICQKFAIQILQSFRVFGQKFCWVKTVYYCVGPCSRSFCLYPELRLIGRASLLPVITCHRQLEKFHSSYFMVQVCSVIKEDVVIVCKNWSIWHKRETFGSIFEKFTKKLQSRWNDKWVVVADYFGTWACGQLVGNCATSIMRFRKGRAGASARGLTQAYLQAVPERRESENEGGNGTKGKCERLMIDLLT